jgi:hypothetical protein
MIPLEYRHVTKSQRRGRPPQGEHALTGAERQARYRQSRAGSRLVAPRPPRPTGTLSRVRRWRAAVAELAALQAEYAAWLDVLPETLREGATGEALQAVVDLDLNEICAIEPPRGFGRD